MEGGNSGTTTAVGLGGIAMPPTMTMPTSPSSPGESSSLSVDETHSNSFSVSTTSSNETPKEENQGHEDIMDTSNRSVTFENKASPSSCRRRTTSPRDSVASSDPTRRVSMARRASRRVSICANDVAFWLWKSGSSTCFTTSFDLCQRCSLLVVEIWKLDVLHDEFRFVPTM